MFLYCLLYWPFSFCLNLGQWWWLVVCVRLMVCKVRVENAKHWVTSCLCMKPNDALRTACNLQWCHLCVWSWAIPSNTESVLYSAQDHMHVWSRVWGHCPNDIAQDHMNDAVRTLSITDTQSGMWSHIGAWEWKWEIWRVLLGSPVTVCVKGWRVLLGSPVTVLRAGGCSSSHPWLCYRTEGEAHVTHDC